MLVIMFPPTLGKARATARAQLLAEALGRQLSLRAQVRVAKTYQELAECVRESTVDIAWAPPSICAAAEERGRPILKAVRHGRTRYCSALVCQRGRNYQLEELQNLRAAWVDPLSTGGHLLALGLLREHGVKRSKAFRTENFHGSYQGALLALLHDRADVSSIYAMEPNEDAVRRALSEHVGASETRLTAFAFTEESPSDGLINVRHSQMVVDVIELLSEMGANRARSFFLDLVEAEGFEKAASNDYWAVRQALIQS